MVRTTCAVIAGIVAWLTVATAGNFALRAVLTGYRAAEAAMEFTLPMQLGRLVLAGRVGWRRAPAASTRRPR